MARIRIIHICRLPGCENATKRGREFCCHDHYAEERRLTLPACKLPGCGNRVKLTRHRYCCHECHVSANAGVHRIFSPAQVEAITAMRAEGKGRVEIAAVLGFKKAQIDGLLYKAKIAAPVPRRFTEDQDDLIRRLINTYKPIDDIVSAVSAACGRPMTRDAVHKRAKRIGASRPSDFHKVVSAKHLRELPPTPRKYVPKQYAPSKPKPIKMRARGAPIGIPLRLVYQWGAQLGLPLDKRGSVEAVSAAMRREEPGHPGFRLAQRMDWSGS